MRNGKRKHKIQNFFSSFKKFTFPIFRRRSLKNNKSQINKRFGKPKMSLRSKCNDNRLDQRPNRIDWNNLMSISRARDTIGEEQEFRNCEEFEMHEGCC